MSISPDAKCPACGKRQGFIRWRADVQLIEHTCQVCFAKWGEMPIMEASEWVTK